MFSIHESTLGSTFAVKVHPRARKNAITGELGDALKVSLTAPPIEGNANEACIEFFANLLKVRGPPLLLLPARAAAARSFVLSGSRTNKFEID